MADQTSEVTAFVWDRHPELDPEDIAKVVAAISAWLEIEMEKSSR
jgi:hypothetical protein